MSTPLITVRAHAKINVSLRITAKRADGYHDLHTVFQTLSLHDTLTFVVRPGPFAITSDTLRMPLDESNLVWRAAHALWTLLGRAGSPADVVVHIRKRIPLQAGLGGGSADAAAALRGLARVWGSEMPPAQLMETAGNLGADVPFFLVGGTALGLGRGDVLQPLTGLPSVEVVLVLPPFGVSTAQAYGWYDKDVVEGGLSPAHPRWPATADDLRAIRSHTGRAAWAVTWPAPAGEIVNDLQASVARRHPVIAEIDGMLRGAGAEAAAMSGSGSSVFGLFATRAGASKAAAEARNRGWRVVRSRTLGAREYDRRSRPVASPHRPDDLALSGGGSLV